LQNVVLGNMEGECEGYKRRGGGGNGSGAVMLTVRNSIVGCWMGMGGQGSAARTPLIGLVYC
jgi:hypothetical protein